MNSNQRSLKGVHRWILCPNYPTLLLGTGTKAVPGKRGKPADDVGHPSDVFEQITDTTKKSCALLAHKMRTHTFTCAIPGTVVLTQS